MTITINGHTIPIDGMIQAEAIQAKADRFRDADDFDGLEQWLYSGIGGMTCAECCPVTDGQKSKYSLDDESGLIVNDCNGQPCDKCDGTGIAK
jgi:hypothetical protein